MSHGEAHFVFFSLKAKYTYQRDLWKFFTKLSN